MWYLNSQHLKYISWVKYAQMHFLFMRAMFSMLLLTPENNYYVIAMTSLLEYYTLFPDYLLTKC